MEKSAIYLDKQCYDRARQTPLLESLKSIIESNQDDNKDNETVPTVLGAVKPFSHVNNIDGIESLNNPS